MAEKSNRLGLHTQFFSSNSMAIRISFISRYIIYLDMLVIMCRKEGGGCCCGGGAEALGILPVKGLLRIAILRVIRDKPAYGSEIQRILKERFSVEAPRATIYILLQRLEEHGFLASSWDTSGSGPAKRIYRITEEGEEYLEDALNRLRSVKDLIDCLISGQS